MPYRSVHPTTGDVVRTFPNHTDAEIESALTTAHSLYKSTWSRGPLRPRLDVLARLADVIAARAEHLASGEQVAALIADGRVQGVALTGPERAGAIVAGHASTHLKKSVLELGGSDAFIVLDDADVDRAARIGAEARLNVAGQVCNAAKRFVVHETIAHDFLKALTTIFSGVVVGDPMDEAVDMGPLCSIESRDEIAAQVECVVKAGATPHYGGDVIPGRGAFYRPTILTNIARDNPAYFEEFFGPVAQVYVVRSDDEAVELANDSPFGLSGAIFTADVERAKRMASRIETGSVWINARSSTSPELPFGGVKRSGYGRELSELGIKELVNLKMVLVGRS